MLPDPPELGNEDPAFERCLCGHSELEHPGGECIRPACGCIVFRPDLRVPSPEAAA